MTEAASFFFGNSWIFKSSGLNDLFAAHTPLIQGHYAPTAIVHKPLPKSSPVCYQKAAPFKNGAAFYLCLAAAQHAAGRGGGGGQRKEHLRVHHLVDNLAVFTAQVIDHKLLRRPAGQQQLDLFAPM